MVGRMVAGVMVQTPEPLQPESPAGIWKLIVLASAFVFAALMASRKEQCARLHVPSSLSFVVLTTSVAGIASLSLMVTMALDCVPRVAPPVGFESVTLNVSGPSYSESSLKLMWTVL